MISFFGSNTNNNSNVTSEINNNVSNVNPEDRSKWQKFKDWVKQHKTEIIIGVGVLTAAVIAYYIYKNGGTGGSGGGGGVPKDHLPPRSTVSPTNDVPPVVKKLPPSLLEYESPTVSSSIERVFYIKSELGKVQMEFIKDEYMQSLLRRMFFKIITLQQFHNNHGLQLHHISDLNANFRDFCVEYNNIVRPVD